MDKLLALKLFVATVDCRGFSAAARQLGLATSSVTRAVGGLERELGAVLLNRSPRQVTVTEAGTSYYLSARQILEQLAEADAAVSDGGDEPSGPLRVSAPVSFGRHRLSPRLGAWLQQYPRLELDLALTDEIVDLLGERVDVSIRLGVPAPMDGVVARPLGQFRRRVVASPAYLARRGTPEHPRELAGHDCLRFDFGRARQCWTFHDAAGTRLQVPVHGRLLSNNIDVLRDAALAGAGLALLPDWLAEAELADGRLCELLPGWSVNPDDSQPQVTALYLPNHRGSRRIAAFMAFVAEQL